MKRFQIMMKAMPDDAGDEWIEAGIEVAETAITADERYLRNMEIAGRATEGLLIRAFSLDD